MKRLIRYLIERSIQFQVKFNLLPIYTYKKGDKVKYNWKAKMLIKSAIEDRENDVLIVLEAIHKRNEFIHYQNTTTNETSWCDAYWLKKTK